MTSAKKLNAATAANRNANATIPALPTASAPVRKDKGITIETNAVECVHAWVAAMDNVVRAEITADAVVLKFINLTFKTAPSFEGFRGAQAALRDACITEPGLQPATIIKAFNRIVKARFGALPVSMSPEAIAKRAQRPGKVAKPAEQKPAAKGANEKQPTTPETIGQFLAKFGIGNVLAECARILATEKGTNIDAKTLEVVASHYLPKKTA